VAELVGEVVAVVMAAAGMELLFSLSAFEEKQKLQLHLV